MPRSSIFRSSLQIVLQARRRRLHAGHAERLGRGCAEALPPQLLAPQIQMRIHVVVVDVLGDGCVEPVAGAQPGPIEHHDVHQHVVLRQEATDGLRSDAKRLFLRVAVGAGGDQRKCDALAIVLPGKLQGAAVAGGQQLRLAGGSAVPHRAHRVDHIAAGQAVAPGELRLTGPAAVECAALGQQLRPCGAVNGAVHAAAAQQGFVGGVDDGVHLHAGDVVA